MGKQPNTGYANFIGNFRLIIEICKDYGAKYAPSNANIEIGAMTAKCDEAAERHNAYLQGRDVASLIKGERVEKFRKMKKLVVRAQYGYKSSGAMASSIKRAMGYVREITGSNVRVKRLANGQKDPKHISNCHMDYATMADNFDKLVQFYKGDPLYAPTEVMLQTANLEALWVELEAATSAVNEAEVQAISLRIERDKCMFTEDTGLYDISLICKSYVKSLFGPSSEEARRVTGIFLRKLVKGISED